MTMTCRIAVLTFLAVAVAFCRSSRADEDGSFCTSSAAFYVADEITLQDFRCTVWPCGQDRVGSLWARVFKKYTIDIAGQEKLRVVDCTEDSDAAVRSFKRWTGSSQVCGTRHPG